MGLKQAQPLFLGLSPILGNDQQRILGTWLIQIGYENTYEPNFWNLFVIIIFCLFFSAAPKTKTTKTTQKKKGTKGAKTYESSPHWKNIKIEFGADLIGDQE